MSERMEERARAKRRSATVARSAAIAALVLTGAFSWVAAHTTHSTSAQATVTTVTTTAQTAAPTEEPMEVESVPQVNAAPAQSSAVATSGAS